MTSLFQSSTAMGVILNIVLSVRAVFERFLLRFKQSQEMLKDNGTYVPKYWLQLNVYAIHIQPQHTGRSSAGCSSILVSSRDQLFP